MSPKTQAACEVGLLYTVALGLALMWACSSAQPCARYGTLEAEYYAALERACGELTEAECLEQKPGAVEGVDEKFRPQFEEAEACQR